MLIRKNFRPIPHWQDYILFYEYFHGDSGAGLGASHQTGWTGLIGRLLQIVGYASGESIVKDPMSVFGNFFTENKEDELL